MEELLRWAAEMGLSDLPVHSPPPATDYCLGHTLAVAHFPGAGGRGLAAARDLRRGELVLRVPRAALLTSDSVTDNDPAVAAAVKRHSYLSSTQILAVCLLVEVGKGRMSRWAPYLHQLPKYYTTLANFKDFEIDYLQVEEAKWVAQRAVEKANSEWEEAETLMREVLNKPQLLAFKSWLWASATVSSRTLHIPWDSAGCLCPVGDLFNYDAPDEEVLSLEGEVATEIAESHEIVSTQRLTDGGYEEATTSYCFYARKNYRKGEQVLLCYGTYTNLDLLEHYGFLLRYNPNDKAFLILDAEMYGSISCPRDTIYIQFDGCPSYALHCMLRLWATPVNLRRSVAHVVLSGSSLSAENELIALSWLLTKCQDILQCMSTGHEDDHSLLCFLDKFINETSCRNHLLQSQSKELEHFLKAHSLHLERVDYDQLKIKVHRSLERWKLAILWRCSYKMALSKCIAYCKEKISNISCQRE